MKTDSIKLKRDKYRRARGGSSRLFKILCMKCGHQVALYQKDGPLGPLKRMYLDRILEPAELVGLQQLPLKKVPMLVCPNCKEMLGVPFLYKKEERPSFRMFEAAVTKKLVRKE